MNNNDSYCIINHIDQRALVKGLYNMPLFLYTRGEYYILSIISIVIHFALSIRGKPKRKNKEQERMTTHVQ